MQLHDDVERVTAQMTAAAALGDERTKEIAAALAAASAAAVRLAIVSAISEAAAEITTALLDFPGAPAVGVRLEDDEVVLEVRATQSEPEAEQPRRDDGEATSRISLRLSDALKTEIDAAADRDGVSVNTWLVRAATTALRGTNGFPPGGRGRRGDQRITGWING